MGAQLQSAETIELEQHAPPLDEYQLKHCGPNYYVWQHTIQQDSIIQFPINIPNQAVLKEQVEMYFLRHRHPLLVSSMYFKRNASSGKASVFYERVYTNLSRIKDIPFEDSLQFYYVALKGFQLLYKRFGYFQIQQSMFHITLNNKMKVWCNKNIEKSKPNPPTTSNGTMEDMIKKIVRIIQQNSDCSLTNYPIGSIIYEQASSSFTSAIQKLRQICRQQKFAIPQKLACLQIINKGDVGILLDQYGQINEQPTFTEQPTTYFQQTQSSQVTNLFSRAHQPNQIRISNTDSKMTTTLQASSNIRNSRKNKGLTISHSLQRINPNRKTIQTAKVNQIPSLNFNVVEQTIPLTRLSRQHENQQMQFPPPQQIRTIPVMPTPNITHNIAPNIIRANVNNLYFPSPQFRNAIPNIPAPQFIQRPATPTTHKPIMQRSNSVDLMNKTNQSFRKTPPQDYRVVVNYADRPNSTLSQFPHPQPQPQLQPKQQSQNMPTPHQVNNFLTVTAPTPPSPISSSPINIHRYFPSQMSKQQYGTQQKPSTNFSFPSNFNASQNQQSAMQLRSNANQNTAPNTPKNLNKGQNSSIKDTFIHKLTEAKNQQKLNPLKDYTNFKSRFEQYKRNFDYSKKDGVQNNFKQEPRQIKKEYNEKHQIYERQNLNLNNINNDRPFFNGMFKKGQTVVSNYGTNQFLKSEDTDRKVESKIKHETVNDFPSVTDVSDNVSYYPSVKKPVQTQNLWRQQSVVVKHDPNQSKIKMPESKKYEPQIDSQIWADMMKVRRKFKQVSTEM